MEKALIISGNFSYFHESLRLAFNSLGYETRVELFDEPVHPFRGWLKWKHKLAYNKELIRGQNRKDYDSHIKQVYDVFQPDIVFVLNRDFIAFYKIVYKNTKLNRK